MGIDPITMMAVMGVAQGVMGAVSGFAGAGGGAADEALRIGRVDAQLARKNAQIEARRLRKQGERASGAAIARYGASGVILAGSPMLVATEILSEAYLDATLALEAGEYRAFTTEAVAEEKARRGRERGIESAFGGAETIIGSLGKLSKLGFI